MKRNLSLSTSILFVLHIVHQIDHARPCSETEIELSNNGQLYVIATPFFPDNYPPNVDCGYRMVAPSDRRVRIFFSSFVLENGNEFNSCIYDYVEIFDGGSTAATSLGKFCGRENPPVMVSTGSELYVVLHSDSEVEKGGFRAEIIDVSQDYIEPSPTPSHNCYYTYSDERGVFYSPDFPNYYGVNAECAYTITTSKPDNTIMLRFPSFDIEDSYNCVYDYVEVRDGATETDALIGRYCGTNLPPLLTSSTGSDMFVLFRSDSSGVYKGFYAEYADSDTGFQDDDGSTSSNQFTVCDLSHAVLTEKGGTIVSHASYPVASYDDSQYCTVTILSSRSQEMIFFDLIENDLPTSEDCGASGDYLQLLDGDATVHNSQTLGYFCGNDAGRYSTQNSFAVVRFITDSVPNSNLGGFKLVYAIYYMAGDNGGCEEGDWLCDNNRCIDRSLVCDGYNHCRDDSDEDRGCVRPWSRAWVIAVLVSAAVIVIVVIAGCIFYKVYHRKRATSPNYESPRGATSSTRSSINSRSPSRKSSKVAPISDQEAYAVENSEAPPSYNSVLGDQSESQPQQQSYLEISRRRGSSDRASVSPMEPRLAPISRSPRTEAATALQMDELPQGRRNILPPIKQDGDG